MKSRWRATWIVAVTALGSIVATSSAFVLIQSWRPDASVDQVPRGPRPPLGFPPRLPVALAAPPSVEWVVVPQPILRGDIAIRVAAVELGKTEMHLVFGMTGKTTDDGLEVVVDIENTSDTRLIGYKLWDESIARLTDNFGNNYKYTLHSLDSPVGRNAIQEGSLYPGNRLRDILVFQAPVQLTFRTSRLRYLRITSSPV